MPKQSDVRENQSSLRACTVGADFCCTVADDSSPVHTVLRRHAASDSQGLRVHLFRATTAVFHLPQVSQQTDAAGRLWSDFPIAPDLARHGSWRHDSLGNSRSTFNQSSHLLQLMHGSPSSFIQVLSLVDSRKDRCSSPQHGNGRCSCGPSKELRLLWSMAQSSWKGCSFLATTCVPERSSARLFSSLDAPAYE